MSNPLSAPLSRFALLLLALCVGQTLWAAPAIHAATLREVMVEVRADRWSEAARMADQAGDPAGSIVAWRRLRAGEGDFDEIRAFLDRHADWPGLDRIRMHGEGQMPGNLPPDQVLAYFAGRHPETGAGALRLVAAYRALGREADAQAEAVLTWRRLPLSAAGQAELLQGYGAILAPHHLARLDEMLWIGAPESARRMYPLVPVDRVRLGTARLALRARAPGVDALIQAVPDDLRQDAGLAYERFSWRAAKGLTDGAIALLAERSISRDQLGQPERWASWRRSYARLRMREHRYEEAYVLAANNFLTEGSDFADLEWLAGFLALRYLDEPQLALAHFERLESAVRSPISLGRAGYWAGRALEAMNRPEAARDAYRRAGRYQTGFYGQLAAEKAGLATDPALIGDAPLPDWRGAAFVSGSVVRAARALYQAGERDLAEWFLTHLAESLDETGQRQLAAMALDWGDAHIALRIAKVAARSGHVIAQAYFPVTDLAKQRHPVPSELVLSIARRESEFDPGVTSQAGARGLMQLMPGTARDVARDLALEYRPSDLLADPDYNARLGAAYLAQLIGEFGQNAVLVAAAYNAGPSRPHRWISEQGDPRSAGVDVVDWIELIPFSETRNYVMRVTESLSVYQARLNGTAAPLRLSEILKGR